jgi:6-phosphofructokinase 1
MTALRGESIDLVPLAQIAGKVKYVPTELLDVASALA